MIPLVAQPPRVQTTVRQLKRRLIEKYGNSLEDMRLFGSVARGEAGAESDIDVLVVLETVGWRERCASIDLATDIGLEHGVLVSPLIFDALTYRKWRTQERPLVVEIEREGIACD